MPCLRSVKTAKLGLKYGAKIQKEHVTTANIIDLGVQKQKGEINDE